MRTQKERRFRENVCDNKQPHEMVRRHVSVSIHETIEEKLFALAKYGDWMPSASAIVEKALSEYFANERIAETIEEAYDKWRKENP